MSKWQPIETAPRDGMTVLLKSYADGPCFTGSFYECDLPSGASGEILHFEEWQDDDGMTVSAKYWCPIPPFDGDDNE